MTVAIDILDEDHSLRLAMLRLAERPDLRTRLGDRGRGVLAPPALEAGDMIDDYRRVITRALATPRERESTRSTLPAHLTDIADRKLHALLEPVRTVGGTLE